jgi:hypothetical protein
MEALSHRHTTEAVPANEVFGIDASRAPETRCHKVGQSNATDPKSDGAAAGCKTVSSEEPGKLQDHRTYARATLSIRRGA